MTYSDITSDYLRDLIESNDDDRLLDAFYFIARRKQERLNCDDDGVQIAVLACWDARHKATEHYKGYFSTIAWNACRRSMAKKAIDKITFTNYFQ